MKKIASLVFVLLLMMTVVANAEETTDWSVAPVVTKAYEQSAGKLYIEWEGQALLYQVYLDGSKIADVIVSHHVIDISKGTHSIVIYPVYELRNAETKIDLAADLAKVSGSISIDLAALGVDPKLLYAGTPSEAFRIDYRASQIVNGTPEGLSAYTDPENRVILTFEDQYNADEYLLTVKHKNDVNYLTYRMAEEPDRSLVTKTNTHVSIVLDPAFLAAQECMQPELNEEYKFTVQLRKYGTDLLKGEKVKDVIQESKVSGEYTYRVTAAWKAAPVITFASQTADGEITLRWEHDDFGAGCDYALMQITKVFGVMTGEVQLGVTKDHEFVLKDLSNGGYCFNVVPVYAGEKGTYSADANVELKNEWVVAPVLSCEQAGNGQVKLSWDAPANVEKYHIIVYTGDNNSLLRFVDLDYSKYTEFDVDAVEGNMTYDYSYDKDIDTVNGTKLKFEVYGLRHTGTGEEQKSAVSSQTIILK